MVWTVLQLLLLWSMCFGYHLSRHELGHDELVLNLSKALRMIFRQSCVAHNMSIFISSTYIDHLPPAQQLLVERTLDQSFTSIVPVVLAKHLSKHLALHKQLMLFFVQNAKQMIAAGNRNPRINTTLKYKYVIVMFTQRTRSRVAWQQAEMRQIFRYFLRQRNNMDVLLLVAQLQGGAVNGYTYYPFSGVRPCGDTRARAVPLQATTLRQLYPHKLHNMNGCPLRVIVWQILPYMELNWERSEPNERISGIDADILKLIAGQLNFSLILVPNEPANMIGGSSFGNGTMTGAFRLLQQKQADLALGFSTCQPAGMKYLACTQPYSQVEYVLVMRRARPYSVYEIMLFPFDLYVWVLLVTLGALRWLYWSGGWQRQRLLDLAWTMLLFTLRVSYESSVFMFVHNAPSRPLPHSLDQAMDQGYTFIIDQATYPMAAQLPAVQARTRLMPGQPVDIFDQLLAQPKDLRIAAISASGFVTHYLGGQPTQTEQELVVASRKIMDNMICVYFPLGSYLTSTINNMLFLMRSSGIAEHIVNRPKRYEAYGPSTLRQQPMGHRTKYVAKFDESMRFLYAALNCLVLALVLSLGIFVLELISQHTRMRWLSTIFDRLQAD